MGAAHAGRGHRGRRRPDSAAAELTLPHPRAPARAFVVVPWLAADPGAQLAGKPLAAWLDALPADEVAAVRPLENGTLR